MKEKYVIGLVGYGYWGPNLLRNLYKQKNIEVKYVCDISPKTHEIVKSLYPTIKTVADYDLVIRDLELDAVVIATPIETHYELVKRALVLGKHVLVEKPLCEKAKDTAELYSIAENKNLTLMTDFTFLFTGAVKKIKQLIDDNEIGAIRYFDSVRINLGLIQQKVNVVWDLAPHDVAILYYILDTYFTNHPDSKIQIFSSGMSFVKQDLENIAYVNLNINNEIMANFHLNWISPVKIRQTLVCGTKKMIVYDDVEPTEKVKIYDSGIEYDKTQYMVNYRTGDILSPKLDTSEALENMIKEFIHCIETRTEPRSGKNISIKVIKTLEAIQKSIKTGKTVKISV